MQRAHLWPLLLALLLALPGAAFALPSYDQVRANYVASDAVLLDRHGEPLQTLRVDLTRRRLAWVPLAEISPALVDAVIAAEDRRFYSHAGVDWLALMHAAVHDLLSGSLRGASTITMQLAAKLDPALKAHRGRRGIAEKWRQIEAALVLERTWTKPQILEAYLNLSSFRGELQGVGAAAQGLFGKHANGLDEPEALLLAALLRSPESHRPVVVRRACALAQRMRVHVSCAQIAARARAGLDAPYHISPQLTTAPQVARRLLKPGMQRVTSSLDAGVQRYALAALRRQLRLLEAQNVNDGAVLVVDNASGEVLAYVGNSGPDSSARFVDGVQALRQPGSALKPFLYELAIEEHLITAASLINDSPVNLVTPSGLYVPQNYDLDFKGLVSARTALSGSLNVPAVRTLMKVGPDAFVTRLRALGFDSITEDGDYYGYALALGSAEVRLWALVNAFRTLANGGVWRPLTLTPRSQPPPGRRVMNAAAAWIVTDILSDRGARSVTFGLDSALATPFWSAVKTGTSSDMRDNWCIGFTPRYTVGVWIGNFSGAPMRDVSGVSGAAPLWLAVMNELNHGGSAVEPAPPAGVIARRVTFARGIEAARNEWFLPGTAMQHVMPKPAHGAQPRIVYPRSGTIIALDPDIPAGHQRVRLQMRPRRAGFVWSVDGRRVAAHDGETLWRPRHGTHTIALHDAYGTEIDEVTFVVRGGAAADAGGAQ